MRWHPLLIGVACWMVSVFATASDLSHKLQSSDHVLLMRHALAPGVSDPSNYSLEDCKTQRNLNDEGKKQAQAAGQWLKHQGITNADVMSSAWCRCKDTAALLEFGGFTLEPTLGSFFSEMHIAKAQNQKLEKFVHIKLKTKGNMALILVTHHVNIYEFAGVNIGSGDMVLAKVSANGKMISHSLIPVSQQR